MVVLTACSRSRPNFSFVSFASVPCLYALSASRKNSLYSPPQKSLSHIQNAFLRSQEPAFISICHPSPFLQRGIVLCEAALCNGWDLCLFLYIFHIRGSHLDFFDRHDGVHGGAKAHDPGTGSPGVYFVFKYCLQDHAQRASAIERRRGKRWLI